MQPEPIKVTQKSSSLNLSQDASSTSNHGHHGQEPHASGSLPSGASGGDRWQSPDKTQAASGCVARGPSPGDPSIARLRSVSPPQPRSPGERIAEHERASTYSIKKRHEGPAFTVVHRRKMSSSGQCSITDFPNGWYLDSCTSDLC